jgi:hypothetical protein
LRFERVKRVYFFGSGQTHEGGTPSMRELEVLDGGHLKLSWEERKAFFEEAVDKQVRGEVKRLLEEALEAERTDWLGVGR